jgi:hypothetical protein
MHVIVLLVIGYLLFHLGHSHANYRHGKALKYSKIRLYWASGLGPYASVRIPRRIPSRKL